MHAHPADDIVTAIIDQGEAVEGGPEAPVVGLNDLLAVHGDFHLAELVPGPFKKMGLLILQFECLVIAVDQPSASGRDSDELHRWRLAGSVEEAVAGGPVLPLIGADLEEAPVLPRRHLQAEDKGIGNRRRGVNGRLG